MTDYRAPLDDMRFVMKQVAGLDYINGLPGYEDAAPDLVDAVLEEAGKLAGEVIAPLNHSGDREGSVFENGVVRTPRGFREAYHAYQEGGWNALPFDPDYGGQGLPWLVANAVQEMWNAANMSFALCPLLNQGAVELLQSHGSPEQKEVYLAKMISGEWTGTMNLTEPQAGTDVGAARTRAEPNGDHYLISGQKIYITYGEHDFAENVVHMVLARTPDAPAGTRGISLFIVPKFLPSEDGGPGPRNDLRCVSIEHKLGIKASPTCVMAYGDSGGAIGYLVGEENRGMEYMFTMMNNARLSVGIQGVAIAERSYQQALAYARQRVQGRAFGPAGGGAVPIIEHQDVKRMLLTMKAYTEAARALAYYTAAAIDIAHADPDAELRRRTETEVVDLLIPVVKAWCTDIGCEVASLGVQVHGGMGFIEETGAAQHFRDARITPIYEGTNGVQALDLIGRKILRLDGAPARAFSARVRDDLAAIHSAEGEAFKPMAESLMHCADTFDRATDWLLDANRADPREAAAGASPYLRLLGTLAGGWLLAKSALAAARARAGANGSAEFLDGKIATARFYMTNLLPLAEAAASASIHGSRAVVDVEEAAL